MFVSLYESVISIAWIIESFTCEDMCIPFMSLPNSEMRYLFECGTTIVRKKPPHEVIQYDAVRSFDGFNTIDVEGVFWYGNPGDGSFSECKTITFPSGDITSSDCTTLHKYLCLCPTIEEEIVGPHVSLRNKYSHGNVGFDGVSVYGFAPGLYTSLNDSRSSLSNKTYSDSFVEDCNNTCLVYQKVPFIRSGIDISMGAPIDGLYVMHHEDDTTTVDYLYKNATFPALNGVRTCPNVSNSVVVYKNDIVTTEGVYEFGNRFMILNVSDIAPFTGRLIK